MATTASPPSSLAPRPFPHPGKIGALQQKTERGRKTQHLAGHLPAERGGHRRAECREKAAVRGSAAPHQDTGLSQALTAAVPRTRLDSLPAGDSDAWPMRPPEAPSPWKRTSAQTLHQGRGPAAGKPNPGGGGTVHQQGLQSQHSLQPRGSGHPRRPQWVISVGLEWRAFPSWSLKS